MCVFVCRAVCQFCVGVCWLCVGVCWVCVANATERGNNNLCVLDVIKCSHEPSSLKMVFHGRPRNAIDAPTGG